MNVNSLDLSGTIGPQGKLHKLLETVRTTANGVVGTHRTEQVPGDWNDTLLTKFF
jgi:hypothetical protein